MTGAADAEQHRPLAERWLTFVTHRPLLTLAACIVFTILSGLAAVNLLGVNSDPIAMLDEDLAFRQTDEKLRAEFPNLDNNLLAVVEAPTPEQATLAAQQVQRELAALPGLVNSVSWPAGSEFFAKNGLLFLSLEDLEALDQRLTAARPLLGRLARQTDAAALFELLIAQQPASSQYLACMHNHLSIVFPKPLNTKASEPQAPQCCGQQTLSVVVNDHDRRATAGFIIAALRRV